MKSRSWLWACALVVAGTGVGLLHWASEPGFQGKRLSQWLDAASRLPPQFQHRQDELEWEQAIRRMGPGALPTLVRILDDEPWLTSQRLFALERSLPRFLRFPRLMLWLSQKAQNQELHSTERALASARALEVLGPDAAPALPALMTRFCAPRHWFSTYRVGQVLARLGTVALPEVLKTFSNPRFTNVQASVEVICRMPDLGSAALPAVPILCRFLQSSDPRLGAACATALGDIHLAPDSAVPVLAAGLQRADPMLTRRCAEALGRFGPSASNAVPALSVALTSADGITTEESARALGQISANASIAVPALIAYLEHGDRRHRRYAIEGLSGYGAAAREVIPLLQGALHDENHDTRAVAAELLDRLSRGE